jgi:hypothetical protein
VKRNLEITDLALTRLSQKVVSMCPCCTGNRCSFFKTQCKQLDEHRGCFNCIKETYLGIAEEELRSMD